ncbi:hypothetical protein G9A89_007704 [Geosiphon pyriformis]|nr:hypothetical protein G9A89_007704 [Geosiphon pyriformis]
MAAINQQQIQDNNPQRNNNLVIPPLQREINVNIETHTVDGCSNIFFQPRSEDGNFRLQQQTITVELTSTFAVIASQSFL